MLDDKGVWIVEFSYFPLLLKNLTYDQINHEHVTYYTLTTFNKILKWVYLNRPNYLRLTISHKPKAFDNLVGQLHKKTPYKTSLMPCIWKKSILKEILKSGESAWDFETKGSLRASRYDNFYALKKNLIYYENAIIKGSWRKSIIDNNFHDLDINNVSRPIMSNYEEFVYYLRKKRSKLFNKLPNFFKNFL